MQIGMFGYEHCVHALCASELRLDIACSNDLDEGDSSTAGCVIVRPTTPQSRRQAGAISNGFDFHANRQRVAIPEPESDDLLRARR